MRPAQPRGTILVTLADGRHFEAPPGTPIGEILSAARSTTGAAETVAALINGRLRELTTPVTADVEVRPVTLADARRHAHLSAIARLPAGDRRGGGLFPDASVFIEHSAPTLGAYFCRVRGRADFSRDELDAHRRAHARPSSQADAPHSRRKCGHARAGDGHLRRARRDRQGAPARASQRRKALVLYELRGRRDYFQGYMVPSTRRPRAVSLLHASARVRAAVSASGQPHRAHAVRAVSEAVRRRSPKRGSGSTGCDIRGAGRAERRDRRRPPAGSVARRRGAARSADRPHRVPTSSPPATGCASSSSPGPPRRARRRSRSGWRCSCWRAGAAVRGRARRLLRRPRSDAA